MSSARTFGDFIARVLSRWRSEQPAAVQVSDAEYLDRISGAVFKHLWAGDDEQNAQDIQTLVFQYAAEEAAKQAPPGEVDSPDGFSRRELVAAVNQLPSIERQCLMFHTCDAMTYKHIAARLEMPPAAVLRHLTMAYSKIASLRRKAG
ncbi:MAG TPA: sigma-70 region 4 domain-containing protein [Gemmatimonadaceae bacterium]|jgi:DNA-directed RNA polymerase specialized sigma24 family protein|nr:sigma-70 region 4 domain-containing protein [Gemmatimonadaceae bacterium]